jgi:hypothetical protein
MKMPSWLHLVAASQLQAGVTHLVVEVGPHHRGQSANAASNGNTPKVNGARNPAAMKGQ